MDKARLSDHAYHRNNIHLTRTQLKTFLESREDYYHQFVVGDVVRPIPSRLMVQGQILHAVLLEGKQVSQLVAVYPNDCLNKNGGKIAKRCEEFEAIMEGRHCVKSDEYLQLHAMVDAFRKSELHELVSMATAREETIFGSYKDRQIKCKPDFYGELDDRLVIYDLKFVVSASPDVFYRNAKRFKYWLQDAHYSAILEQYTTKPVVFRFIACETSAPYRIDWFEYDMRSRELAREQWQRAMDDIIHCERTGNFEDNHHHTLTLDLWDVSPELAEAELEGFADE